MEYTAKTVSIVSNGMDLFFAWVDKEDNTYEMININIDQVVLLLKQSAEIISRCSIVRPIP